MKVILIYRNRVEGANSIEELFHTISKELKQHCEIVEYQLGSRGNFFQDIINIRKIKADVYHITGEVHYVACFLPKHKTMLTIHDIHHYNNNLRGWKKLVYRWIFLTFPLKSVKILTTISKQTKEMLVNNFTKLPQINVIENCYNEALFKFQKKSFNTDEPTLLHIGTKTNKNLLRLIQSITNIRCKLVIIGKLTNEQLDLLNKYKINYQNSYNLSLEEVYNNYVASDIVAFVSLSEGFGLPIIEAQAVGRVVITSQHDPMSSVAGNSACLVDAWSVESIKLGLEKIIADASFREKLIDDGRENIARFTPSSVSKQYYQLYLSFLK